MLIQLADILTNLGFIQPYCAHTIPASPEMITGQIFRSPKMPSMDQYRRLAFEFSQRVGNAILGWDTQAHVYMVRHRIALHQLKTKLFTHTIPEESLQSLCEAFQRSLFFGTSGSSRHGNGNTTARELGFSIRALALPFSAPAGLDWKSLFRHKEQPRIGRTFSGLTARGGGLTVGFIFTIRLT